MQELLESFNEVLEAENPFSCLMDSGIYAADDDFTDDEYERMHEYFCRYVGFVERVLDPWRDAFEAGDNENALIQGYLWQRRLGDVVAFRSLVVAQMNPGAVTAESAALLAEIEERMNAIDQGPLHALIALAIMDEQLNGMHGVWCELRDCLNEPGNEGMEPYTEAVRAAMLWRLEVLNALLVPEELLPINGCRVNQAAFNRRVLELHRMLRNSMVLLFLYANERTRREGDWEAFEQTGQFVDAFIAEHFPRVTPLEIEDPEGSELEDEDDVTREDRDEGEEDSGEDYLDEDERAWWRVYGVSGRRVGGTHLRDSPREGEADYSDEEADTMDSAADDDEGGGSGYSGPEVETEEMGLVDRALRAGTNAAVPAVTAFLTHVHGRQGHGGCR